MAELILKAQGGDRRAFGELVEQHRGRLTALIHARLGPCLRNRVEIEDVLQEALLTALKSVDRFQYQEPDSFFRWLCGITVNVIYKVAAREKRKLLMPLDSDPASDEVSPSRAGQRNERFDRLQASLSSLSPDHRQVILLARVERLPIKEVALRMNRSPEAVTQLLWRALRKLKESFGSTDSFHLPARRLEDRGDHRG